MIGDDGGEEGKQEPPEEEDNRAIENAVMLGFFALLVAAGIWLLGTMADVRKVRIAPPRDAATARRSTRRRDNEQTDEAGEPRCGKQSCRWRWWF